MLLVFLLVTDHVTVEAAAVLLEEGVLVETEEATLAHVLDHLATAAGVDTPDLHPDLDPPLAPVLLLAQSLALLHLTNAGNLVHHLLQWLEKVLAVLLETTTARQSQVHVSQAAHQEKEVALDHQLLPSHTVVCDIDSSVLCKHSFSYMIVSLHTQ